MAEETDAERAERLSKLSDRDLARRTQEGSRRDAQEAEKILKKRGKSRYIEDLKIGGGATPKNPLRRLTGW